ncbi:hypothetical protein RRG08_065972 [Elysia crispata]|uniref:Uncharacterized protein n=1 Tax=Elysia crispata TaxID=231223 RepID=A0AAE0YEJ7_9GAST|nr:hypothetical protein RRG08_065972 [Elysia crispata]
MQLGYAAWRWMQTSPNRACAQRITCEGQSPNRACAQRINCEGQSPTTIPGILSVIDRPGFDSFSIDPQTTWNRHTSPMSVSQVRRRVAQRSAFVLTCEVGGSDPSHTSPMFVSQVRRWDAQIGKCWPVNLRCIRFGPQYKQAGEIAPCRIELLEER